MKRRLYPPQFIAPLTPCNVPVQRCPVPMEQASRRILIVRLGAHGDIVMGSPLLAALRRAWPDAHLTWMAERPSCNAVDASPYVDEIIAWDGTYWKQMLRLGLHPLWLVRALVFQRKLRRRHTDIFISLQPEEWPLLVRGVGAPMSVGVFDTFRQFNGSAATSAYTRLYTQSFTHTDLPPHRTDQYLLPLRALGLPDAADKQMTLGYTARDRDQVGRYLSENGVTETDRLVVLAPMTTWPSRCWPEENYAALGDLLTRKTGFRVILIGSHRERQAVMQIAAQMQTAPILAAGDFGFREMAALIARSSLLISGDTGPMHVASAVGTPYLALFGPTPWKGRAPLSGRGIALAHPVPCGPCDQKICPNAGEDFMRCLRQISVSRVMKAVTELLEEANTGAADRV